LAMLATMASKVGRMVGLVLFNKSVYAVAEALSWQDHTIVFSDSATHQRLGPPGLRIWKTAVAEPTKVPKITKEAR